MRSKNAPVRLLAIALVFIVLGAVQWAWFDPKEFGQGAITGGIVVAIVAIFLIVRARPTHRSTDPGR
ncbi:MAG: hypothetical protein OEM39_00200 [Acidimicrobiia bacterium]|nr:hypothetical protein [Acidimicrobiia bacterium]